MDLYFFQHLNLKIRSDLGFLYNESVLLQNFLSTHFSSTLSNQTISRVQLWYDKLVQIGFAQSSALEILETHENNLLSKSIVFLEIESERIAASIKDLGNTFKDLKREVFAFYKDSTATDLIIT